MQVKYGAILQWPSSQLVVLPGPESTWRWCDSITTNDQHKMFAILANKVRTAPGVESEVHLPQGFWIGGGDQAPLNHKHTSARRLPARPRAGGSLGLRGATGGGLSGGRACGEGRAVRWPAVWEPLQSSVSRWGGGGGRSAKANWGLGP